ncbi:hypothetical protein ACTFIT_003392 [Dictyostelium discoideum]
MTNRIKSSNTLLTFDANEVTNIKLVWDIEELKNKDNKENKDKENKAHIKDEGEEEEQKEKKEEEEKEDDGGPISFHPTYSHQIFNEDKIQGYEPCKIDIYMGAGSLTSYIDTNYTLQSKNLTNVEGEFLKVFSKQDPPISKQSFYKYIEEKEKLFKPIGKKIHEYSIIDKESGKETEYEIYFGRITDQVVFRYHEKLQIFVLWYIDGSSYIWTDDPNWDIFFIFEKRIIDGEKRYGITGYSTIYNFYHHPEQTRARISQYLILPPYQRMGHGKYLFNSIYQYYKTNDGFYGPIYDITIEDPADEFNLLRNYVDLKNIMDEKLFDNVILDLNANNKSVFEEIRKKLLIPYKQSKLCLEIYLFSKFLGTPNSDTKYKEYRISIKKRLYKQNIGDSEQIEKIKQQVAEENQENLRLEQEELQELQDIENKKNGTNIKVDIKPKELTTPPGPEKNKEEIEKDRLEEILELYKELEENYHKTLSSLNLISK